MRQDKPAPKTLNFVASLESSVPSQHNGIGGAFAMTECATLLTFWPRFALDPDLAAHFAVVFQTRFELLIERLIHPARDFRDLFFNDVRRWRTKINPARRNAAVHDALRSVGQTRPERLERRGVDEQGEFAAREVIFTGTTNQTDSNAFRNAQTVMDDLCARRFAGMNFQPIEMGDFLPSFAPSHRFALFPAFNGQCGSLFGGARGPLNRDDRIAINRQLRASFGRFFRNAFSHWCWSGRGRRCGFGNRRNGGR